MDFQISQYDNHNLSSNLYDYKLDSSFLKIIKKSSSSLKKIADKIVVESSTVKNRGYVNYVGDGIARVSGLRNAMVGEMIEVNETIQGIVLNLEEN